MTAAEERLCCPKLRVNAQAPRRGLKRMRELVVSGPPADEHGLQGVGRDRG